MDQVPETWVSGLESVVEKWVFYGKMNKAFFHFFGQFFFAYLMIFQSGACPSPITYVLAHLRKIKCDLFNIYLVSKQFEYGEAFTNMKCKRNIK